MLKTRIITAILMLAVFLSALFGLPHQGWSLFTAIIAAAAAWEWGGLMHWPASRRIFYAATCLALFSLITFSSEITAWVSPHFVDLLLSSFLAILGLSILFWLVLAPLWLHFGWRLQPHPITSGAIGLILITATWLALVICHSQGPWFVLSVLGIVWLADTAAYFSGRTFGRHKLAPKISPGKTWEGAIGAAIAVSVYGLTLAYGWPVWEWPLPLFWVIPFMLLLTAISVIGDLFESMLKRQAELKDSSNLLPGHGGILDRIDSVMATMPIITVWMVLTFPAY